jgi:hypothetical protein
MEYLAERRVRPSSEQFRILHLARGHIRIYQHNAFLLGILLLPSSKPLTDIGQ